MTILDAVPHCFSSEAILATLEWTLDWGLVALSVLAVGYALVQAVYRTLRPGETEARHIKRVVLEEEG